MEIKGEAKLLRVFLGESDKHHHVPLYEKIVHEARAQGLAGATAWRGILSFGANARIRTAKVLDLSSDLPIVLEIVDSEEKIDAFVPVLSALLEEANSGGIVTLEKAQVIRYLHGSSGGDEPEK